MEAYIVFERSVRSSSRLVRRWSKHVRDRFDLPSGTFSDDFLSTSFTVSSELVAKQLPERSVLAPDRFSTLNFTVPSQLVTEQVPDRADLAHGTGFRTLNFTVPSQLVTEQVPIGPICRFRDIRTKRTELRTDEHRFLDPPTQ